MDLNIPQGSTHASSPVLEAMAEDIEEDDIPMLELDHKPREPESDMDAEGEGMRTPRAASNLELAPEVEMLGSSVVEERLGEVVQLDGRVNAALLALEFSYSTYTPEEVEHRYTQLVAAKERLSLIIPSLEVLAKEIQAHHHLTPGWEEQGNAEVDVVEGKGKGKAPVQEPLPSTSKDVPTMSMDEIHKHLTDILDASTLAYLRSLSIALLRPAPSHRTHHDHDHIRAPIPTAIDLHQNNVSYGVFNLCPSPLNVPPASLSSIFTLPPAQSSTDAPDPDSKRKEVLLNVLRADPSLKSGSSPSPAPSAPLPSLQRSNFLRGFQNITRQIENAIASSKTDTDTDTEDEVDNAYAITMGPHYELAPDGTRRSRHSHSHSSGVSERRMQRHPYRAAADAQPRRASAIEVQAHQAGVGQLTALLAQSQLSEPAAYAYSRGGFASGSGSGGSSSSAQASGSGYESGSGSSSVAKDGSR